MESFRKHSTVKLFKAVGFWSWVGRIVPMAYIPASLAYFHYNNGSILHLSTVIFFTVTPFIAITWWWWAMDTMKWLSQLYTDSIDKQMVIINELKEIRTNINQNSNDNNSNR